MAIRVVIWGTGNIGRPALRAVLSHQQLELVGVIVPNAAKEGKDAGCDALVYTATGDGRTEPAINDILSCLTAGINVVSVSLYPLLYDPMVHPSLRHAIVKATRDNGASVFVSGIDPGWAMDALPLFLSGASSNIKEIRCQEIFNYALYDQPDVVRDIIGFGTSMTSCPPMLLDGSLRVVWEPTVRMLGDALNVPVDKVDTRVERRPLDRDIDIPGMGYFAKGTQGAFRFEVIGYHKNQPRYVVEHITRIHHECAPDWPYPPQGEGCHRILISGTPDLEVTVHAEDAFHPGPAGGGNASAACRLVNAIPLVCAAPAGVVDARTIPMTTGEGQLHGN